MAGTLTHDRVQGPPQTPPGGGWGDGGRGGGGEDGRGSSRRRSFAGLFVLLVTTTMLFAAFTTALLLRRGVGEDWAPMPKPRILLLNTAVLLASSVALELARRALRARRRTAFNGCWTAATLLGVLFLVGQAVAWRQLHKAGVFIWNNPSHAFFYMLTVAHAIHLVGGVVALLWVDVQALRLRLGPAKRTAIDICAIFWHFLDGVWLYLMVLFYVWG
jgi:cytochrome c oxidase subunit 3